MRDNGSYLRLERCTGCGKYYPSDTDSLQLRHGTLIKFQNNKSLWLRRKCDQCSMEDWGKDRAQEYMIVVAMMNNGKSIE